MLSFLFGLIVGFAKIAVHAFIAHTFNLSYRII